MRARLGAALGAVALLSVPAAPPAHAVDSGVMTCELIYDAYGAGPTTASGECWIGAGTRSGSVSLRADANIPPSTCPLTEDMNGTMSGAFNATFGLTRIGPLGALTFNGDLTGIGKSLHIIEGNPCGGLYVRVTVIIWFCGL